MAALTALRVQKARHPEDRKGPFLLSDGHGLALQIMPSGSKSWVLRYMLNGKARTMGLGAYGDNDGGVSLATARERAASARSLVKQGIDPIDARQADSAAKAAAAEAKAARSKTFEEVAREYIAAHAVSWANKKHRAQWSATLEAYAYPIIGEKAVADVDADDVEAVLKPIWLEISETASRVRGRIEVILDFAKAKSWRSGENPARWKESMKHRLPSVSRTRKAEHHPALPWQQVPAFFSALRAMDSISARCLQFSILTACRSGEARGARWREIDLKNAVWTVPAERMKARREHRVPLSKAAIAVLQGVTPLSRGPDSIIFPSVRAGKALSDMALSQLLRGMNEIKEGETPPWLSRDGRPIVTHGFRSSFRDWAEEATSTPHAVSEAALAHVVADKVEAAYRRTDLFDKRQILMGDWAKHCIGAAGMIEHG